MKFWTTLLLYYIGTLGVANCRYPAQAALTLDSPPIPLDYVDDSGICETTPGVQQKSGYLNVDSETSLFFWFFEARDSPDTAPLTLWINGGPGCSSLIGMFQENGPCQVNDPKGRVTELNPYSWNNLSNVVYIDQPVGAGFSYGDLTVNSTEAAAAVFWSALQIFFTSEDFSKFQTRDFILATESYGGHYGPGFVSYFNRQNEKIRQGTLSDAVLINVTTLMINNGLYDFSVQYKAYIDFVTNAPRYGQLQTDEVIASLNDAYYAPGGCEEQMQACVNAGDTPESNNICRFADSFCNYTIFQPAVGDRFEYDLRQRKPGYIPTEYYLDYLNDPEVRTKINAKTEYAECSNDVDWNFRTTGDEARSTTPLLAELADSGMHILIWAGDADISCNWIGGQRCILGMDWYGKERLANTPLTEITFNGATIGAAQSVDNFTYAVVYDAGHEVPAYQPAVSFEIFKQMVNKETLHSV